MGPTPGFEEVCTERCYIRNDEYRCQQRTVDASEFPLIVDVVRPRRVRVVRDAFDFSPDIEFFDGGIVDCSASGLNDLLTGVLQGSLESQFGSIIGRLTGSLTRDLREWGIPYPDLVDCGRTDPVSGEVFPSDAMCGDALPQWFGGRRHGCVGINDEGEWTDDPAVARAYRCARARIEVRRLNMRPDGIELVVADSLDDPQHDMLTTSSQSLLRSFCEPDRDGAPPGLPPTVSTPIARADSAIAQLGAPTDRRICHPDVTVQAPTNLDHPGHLQIGDRQGNSGVIS